MFLLDWERFKKVSWYKIKARLIGILFFVWRRKFFASPPIIEGVVPKIFCAGRLNIGRKCVFRSSRVRQHLTVLGGGRLDVGENVFMNDGVNICATGSIKIGDFTKIGDMVYVYDSDFHQVSPDVPVRKASVLIGKNVWLGANSMILAGASIGDHSVIAAGSIVTGDIPAKSLAAGSPARVIKTFDVPDGWVRP
jgi:acetyltransferase-like isoleucine patch superfamily enzyme